MEHVFESYQWKTPFTAVVAGPTSCGKTQFIFRFIKHVNQLMSPPPSDIVYCYGAWQDGFNTLKNVQFHEGLPDKSLLKQNRLLIIDDLMNEASDSSVVDLFTKHSHHSNVSVVFVAQNFFHKNLRNITLNAHYIILFKSPRDQSQISHLARQMYPRDSKYLVEAFKDATERAYGYLMIDLKADTNDNHRLRTFVFPDENGIVYVPRKKIE